MSPVNYVAYELMKAWFPKSHSDRKWLESDDGKNWTEISINAYKEYLDKKYES